MWLTHANTEFGQLPNQDPTKVFTACGAASCSSVRLNGVDVGSLKARANALGYSNTGRRGVGKAKQCKANKQHKEGKKNDGRFNNGQKSNSATAKGDG